MLISCHLDALVKVNKVKSVDDLEGLRKLYNDVETCVRNLKSLKVEMTTYGCLLIPLLKEKLPDELLIIKSRGFGSDIWTLDQFIKLFNAEIQVKENCFSLKKEKRFEKYHKILTSAENLYVQSDENRFSVHRCLYCLGGHSATQCSKVPDIKGRMNKLKRFSKCFLCLKGGHIAGNCS